MCLHALLGLLSKRDVRRRTYVSLLRLPLGSAQFDLQFFSVFFPFCVFFPDAIFLVSSLSRAFDNFFLSEFHPAANESRSSLS